MREEIYLKDIVPEKRKKVMKVLGISDESELTEPLFIVEKR